MKSDEKEPTPAITTMSVTSSGVEREMGLTTWLFETNSFVPAAKIVGNKRYSIPCDYLGTPVQAYDENGTKVWDCELDIYGNIRSIKEDNVH